ncbi:MAG: hypothetical protein LN416_07995 [Candidatus Thermoplasmatota archaeon]|nr:hypothetical protein [Candidatus Thermoplasmatota archaeon]
MRRLESQANATEAEKHDRKEDGTHVNVSMLTGFQPRGPHGISPIKNT